MFREKEKDLDVIFDNNLKFSSYNTNQLNIANQLMGLIRSSYTYLDKNSLQLFISQVCIAIICFLGCEFTNLEL